MLESNFTGKILKALRQHPRLAGAVIWKHNDYYTSGIPDFSITHNAQTTWFEVKIWPNKLTPIQKEFLKRLGVCSFLIVRLANGEVAIERTQGICVVMKFDEAIEFIAKVC